METRPPRRRCEAGFSLIESVVTIVLVGGSLVAGISLMGMQQDTLSGSHRRSSAVRYLTRELERVRATPVRELGDRAPAAIAEDTTFTRQWVVTRFDDDSKQVEVTISWQDDRAQRQSAEATTLRSPAGE